MGDGRHETRTTAAVDPVIRARGVLPALRSDAAASDRRNRLTVSVLAALGSAGLLGLRGTEGRDGRQLDCNTIGAVVATLAEEHASAAWVVGSFARAAVQVAADPVLARAASEHGEGLLIADAHGAPARAAAVKGGFRLTGLWHSVPGSAHADLALVSFVLPGGDPEHPVRAVLPMPQLTRHETWDAAGARGASPETLEAEGVFVRADAVGAAGLRRGYDPAHAIVPASTVVGAASGALDHALASVRNRPWPGTRYETAAESATIQGKLTDAAMHISSARLHLHRAATSADRYAVDAAAMPPEVRIRSRVDIGCATSAAVSALDSVMSAIGAQAVAETAPFERAWRDVQTLSRHAAVDPLTAREAFGHFLVGRGGALHEIPL